MQDTGRSRKRRGFTLIELLIVITVIMIIATAATFSLPKFLMKSRETAAVTQIKHLHEAQAMYRSDFGKFAISLAQLGPSPDNRSTPNAAGLITSDLALGLKGGYKFEMTGRADGYTITAVPNVYNTDGRRSFFSDESMVMRENWGPEPATAASPEVK
ncbi:MAG: type II secretion system protein [Acidobacteria bacterium]|nr:type II secretion system protein [Acidobacteriota bacterium]